MSEPITMDRGYQTRDGRPVRVIGVDGKNDYPVVAWVPENNSREAIRTYTKDGRYYASSFEPHPEDLIPRSRTHEVKVKLRLYSDGGDDLYVTATDHGTPDLLAIKDLIVTFTEGEGLE